MHKSLLSRSRKNTDRRIRLWRSVHPAVPWLLAGAGATIVWLLISYLFWLDIARDLGRAPGPGDVGGLLLYTGPFCVLIGMGAGFVAYAGLRGIRLEQTPRRIVFGGLEILLGTLIWLAAAIEAFVWIGLIAVG